MPNTTELIYTKEIEIMENKKGLKYNIYNINHSNGMTRKYNLDYG